jgi:DNA processing protein
MATEIAYGMATAGWTVVSGLARGIDAAAHRGALEACGATVAVLGCGVDRVYPARNRDLYAALARDGLLLTEFPPGTPPLKHHFPRRNRIIAALAEAVVVVQAGLPSGALITADIALDLGRGVFAVPGPADQSASHGSHRLLRDGATIATSAADVLAVLEGVTEEAARLQLSLFRGDDRTRVSGGGPGEHVRAGLLDGPASLYEVAERSGLDVSDAVATLGRLELRGVIRSLPGLRYELVERST